LESILALLKSLKIRALKWGIAKESQFPHVNLRTMNTAARNEDDKKGVFFLDKNSFDPKESGEGEGCG
jgi:hypothetical protein